MELIVFTLWVCCRGETCNISKEISSLKSLVQYLKRSKRTMNLILSSAGIIMADFIGMNLAENNRKSDSNGWNKKEINFLPWKPVLRQSYPGLLNQCLVEWYHQGPDVFIICSAVFDVSAFLSSLFFSCLQDGGSYSVHITPKRGHFFPCAPLFFSVKESCFKSSLSLWDFSGLHGQSCIAIPHFNQSLELQKHER